MNTLEIKLVYSWAIIPSIPSIIKSGSSIVVSQSSKDISGSVHWYGLILLRNNGSGFNAGGVKLSLSPNKFSLDIFLIIFSIFMFFH